MKTRGKPQGTDAGAKQQSGEISGEDAGYHVPKTRVSATPKLWPLGLATNQTDIAYRTVSRWMSCGKGFILPPPRTKHHRIIQVLKFCFQQVFRLL